MYFLYILHSTVKDIYYTGSSVNPPKRLGFHNTIERGFTARYRPWKLVFTKGYKTKAEALRAERKIKAFKSKKMIKKIISGEIDI